MTRTAISLEATNELEKVQVDTGRHFLVPMLSSWLLMVMTFSLPGRELQVVGSLDAIALMKLATRGLCLVLLAGSFYLHWNHPSRRVATYALTPWFGFVGLAVASAAWSPLKSITVGQSASVVVLVLLSLCIATAWRSNRDTSTVLFHLSACLFALSSALLLISIFAPELGSLNRDGSGLFHSTSAGSTASLGLILLVASRVLWGWRWSRLMFVPGVVLHASVQLMALNRVSLALSVVALMLLICLFANRTMVLFALVAISSGIAVFLMVDAGMSAFIDPIDSVTSYASRGQSTSELSALSGRLEMWEAIWGAYMQSPIVGHGYFVCSPTGELFVWNSWENWTAHNLILQVLMSVGFVGLLFLAWGFLRIANLWWWRYRHHETCPRLNILMVTLLFWNIIWGAFNASFMGPLMPVSIVFYAVLGLAVGAFAQGFDPDSAVDAVATWHPEETPTLGVQS